MVDLNKDIAEILKHIAKVENEFPSYDNDTFPCITICEITNTGTYDTEGKEIASDIVFQVDVWDKSDDLKNVNKLAEDVNKVMYKNKYTRTLGRGFKDASGLMRKMMYFKISIINIYKKEID